MTDTGRLDATSLYAYLDRIEAQIAEAKSVLEELYDERRHVFRGLVDAGESQASVARRIGRNPMVVSAALARDDAEDSPGP